MWFIFSLWSTVISGTVLNAFVISDFEASIPTYKLFLLEFFCSSSILRTICAIERNIGEFRGHLLVNLVTNNMKAQTAIKGSAIIFLDGETEAQQDCVTYSGFLIGGRRSGCCQRPQAPFQSKQARV